MTVLRPRLGVRAFETIGPRAADLAAGAGHKVIEARRPRVLEVVLVTGEHHAHAGSFEQRQQFLHAARVVVLRAGAVKRVMREWNAPHRLHTFSRERLLDEIPVLWKFKQAIAAEEIFLRRIDADKLDVGSV